VAVMALFTLLGVPSLTHPHGLGKMVMSSKSMFLP
jgi:hypothetical protein